MKIISSILYNIVFCTILLTSTAHATSNPEAARDFIKSIGDKVIAIVATTQVKDDIKEQQLNNLFIEIVDIEWIAKFVVGRYWRESTPEQQEKYLKLYRDFLIHSYVSKFRQYTDQKLLINKFLTEAENEYLVDTTINDKDNKNYNVSYKVKNLTNTATASESFKIYDIIAEGVSLITTQRSEFGSILSREGMDALIKKLEQKN